MKHHIKHKGRRHELRTNKISIMLNDSELRALQKYCNRYSINNRSQFIRQTLMRKIIKRFDEDSPTLFGW